MHGGEFVVPNRIFVGGIPKHVNENELKGFFSSFGQVKDTRIINDGVGVSKGYGFVTFENEIDVKKLLDSKGESLVFHDNHKLNIAKAKRKPMPFNQNNSSFANVNFDGSQVTPDRYCYSPSTHLTSNDNNNNNNLTFNNNNSGLNYASSAYKANNNGSNSNSSTSSYATNSTNNSMNTATLSSSSSSSVTCQAINEITTPPKQHYQPNPKQLYPSQPIYYAMSTPTLSSPLPPHPLTPQQHNPLSNLSHGYHLNPLAQQQQQQQQYVYSFVTPMQSQQFSNYVNPATATIQNNFEFYQMKQQQQQQQQHIQTQQYFVTQPVQNNTINKVGHLNKRTSIPPNNNQRPTASRSDHLAYKYETHGQISNEYFNDATRNSTPFQQKQLNQQAQQAYYFQQTNPPQQVQMIPGQTQSQQQYVYYYYNPMSNNPAYIPINANTNVSSLQQTHNGPQQKTT